MSFESPSQGHPMHPYHSCAISAGAEYQYTASAAALHSVLKPSRDISKIAYFEVVVIFMAAVISLRSPARGCLRAISLMHSHYLNINRIHLCISVYTSAASLEFLQQVILSSRLLPFLPLNRVLNRSFKSVSSFSNKLPYYLPIRTFRIILL